MGLLFTLEQLCLYQPEGPPPATEQPTGPSGPYGVWISLYKIGYKYKRKAVFPLIFFSKDLIHLTEREREREKAEERERSWGRNRGRGQWESRLPTEQETQYGVDLRTLSQSQATLPLIWYSNICASLGVESLSFSYNYFKRWAKQRNTDDVSLGKLHSMSTMCHVLW